LTQVAFGVQNAPDEAVALPDLALTPLDVDPGTARLELTLWVTEGPEGLTALWTYSTDLFEAATVEALHRRFTALLEAAVADPGARLEALAASGEEERRSDREAFQAASARRLLAVRRRPTRREAPDLERRPEP
jgi:non-ribosomal peptide synthetase component F